MLRRQRNLPIARRPDAAPADNRPAVRGGFTLVEMMVAVMILAVGLLGMASTSAYVLRQIGGGVQHTTAANVVQSRTEWLRSLPCAQVKDSSAVTRGIKEKWVKGATANNVLTVIDSVQYSNVWSWAGADKSGTTKRAFTIMIPCW